MTGSDQRSEVRSQKRAKRYEIRDAILRERGLQDRKYGPIETHGRTVREWIAIMQDELEEAADAWLLGFKGEDGDQALAEILQVVAVGYACLEQHGVVERKPHEVVA